MKRKRPKAKRSKATVGYIPSQKTYFYGFRLHWMMTPTGMPYRLVILPAHIHDSDGLKSIQKYLENNIITGDKAYVGIDNQKKLYQDQNTILLTPRKNGVYNQNPNWIANSNELRVRGCIETAHSQFEGMGMKRPRMRDDLGTKLVVYLGMLTWSLINASKGRRGAKKDFSRNFGG